MFEKRIEIEGAQSLTLLDMVSNVALEGWDERAVMVRLRDGDEKDLSIEEGEEGPVLSARQSVEIRLPADLRVRARNVHGNLAAARLGELSVEQVRGNLALDKTAQVVATEVYGNLKADSVESVRVPGTVYGSARLKAVEQVDVQNVRSDLVVKSAGRLRATRVQGNLVAKQIGEGIDVDEVGGNATLKDVAAAISIDRVAGNLAGKNLMGGARVPRTGGNVALSGPLGEGKSYHFRADGNAVIRLPEDVGADVTLKAGGKVIAANELEQDDEERGRWTGKLGAGGAELVVEAGGNVILGGDAPRGWVISDEMSDEMARQMEDVARQIEEAMRGVDFEAIGRQVSSEVEDAMSRLRVKLESVDWERMGRKTQEAIERAMGRLQQDVDRAADHAARQQERAARQQEAAAARQAGLQARAEARAARYAKRAAAREEADAWVDEMEAEAGQPDGVREETYARAADSPSPWEGEVEGADDLAPDMDEERLSILRMVEQGQISPEEAEMLLDALE